MSKVFKFFFKAIAGLAGLVCTVLAVRFVLVCREPEIIPIEIGEVHFTDKYNPEARLLIPAAYTGEDGAIEGEYRIAGKTYGTPVRKERISLHPVKGLVISGKWHSDYGFQQTVLVKNGRVRTHEDPRKTFRRALGTVDGQFCIFQSRIPMTLNRFSESIHKYCSNAVNLDMGNYGYGWYGKRKFSRIFRYNRDKQTNWLCIE